MKPTGLRYITGVRAPARPRESFPPERCLRAMMLPPFLKVQI